MRNKNKVNKKPLKKRIIRYLPIDLMALPGLIYLFINNYMPLPGLVLAFKKYSAKKGIFGSKFVGLNNFKYLFATQDAFVITRNTILYNVAFIIINTILAVFVAICRNDFKMEKGISVSDLIALYDFHGNCKLSGVWFLIFR